MSVDSDDEMFDRAKLAQMAASMTPEVRANIVHQAEEIIPMMHKEDIKNIVADEEDEVFKCSEEMTFEWIEMFLSDVNRIERFFTDKKEQLINEFIVMQEKFRLKSN
jgi:acyl-CoA reductase-like NAD-dependent aldehyde dehydrogenase